ncbi:MAG: alginate export family protein [Deltaproteobacteria bacterium]
MLTTNGKLFSLFTVLFSLFLSVTESNGQAFDPDDPPETTIKLAPYLSFGAQIEVEYKYQRNLDLDTENDEDLSTLEPEIVFAFLFNPSRYFEAFAALKFAGEFEFEDGDTKKDQAILEFEQAYLLFKDLWEERLAFQLGRQRFEDERQWLYDAELDGVRTFLQFSSFLAEFSVSTGGLVNRDLLNKDAGDKINNYIAHGTYAISEESNVAAYFIFRDNTKENGDSPIFFGIHSDGELAPDFDYWLELAYVIGKNGTKDINGVGFDIGSTYVFDVDYEPSVTLGYAFGQEKFRQTGLQANESDFNGAVDFIYYGELLDPELSNMSIFTAGAGVNPTEESSLDLIYHYYLQTKASDSLRDAEIDADPEGRNKSLGSEIDFIVGYEGFEEKFALALSLGYFIPGNAFPSDSENAFLTKVIVEYQF